MGVFEVELSPDDGCVVDGEMRKDVDSIGKKVEAGRPVVSAAGRGTFA